MFGYVLPNQNELKVRELKEYRSFYCGLCRILKERYGLSGQMSLNYDMTFLGILLTSLYEPEVEKSVTKCIAHPFEKHQTSRSEHLEYAADMNILLTYYKCLDDWKDEHKVMKAGYGMLLRRAGRRVSEKYPDKAARIENCLDMLSEAEEAEEQNIDYVSGLFGEICSCLFRYKNDEWADELHRIGFFMGKFIYLMDAYEDLEKDREKNCYNPFLPMSGKQNFDEQAYQILTMMMAEAGRAFEKLPIILNAEILRNIIYSGVWCRYQAVREKNNPEEKS